MEGSNNKAKIVVAPFGKANGVIVNVGFKTPNVNWFVLRKLRRNEPCGCDKLSNGSEATALAYAVFQHVNDKLVGSPQAQSKNKATSVCCSYQNGEFTLHITCQGTVSVVNRVLSETCKALVPDKLFPRYQANIRMLGGAPHREEFNACVNEMASGLGKLSVCVVGKINMGKGAAVKERMNKLLKTVNDKLGKVDKASPAKKPASLSEKKGDTEFSKLSASGGASVYVCDYLTSTIKVPVSVNSGHVIVYDKNFDSKKSALRSAKRVKAYVNKYSKIKDLGETLAYSAASYCYLNASALQTLAKSNPKLAKIEDDIKTALK